MNNSKLQAKLNDLLPLFGTERTADFSGDFKSFGLSEGAITLEGESVQKFNEGVKAVLKEFLQSESSLSPKTVENLLVPKIREKVLAKAQFSEEEAAELQAQLLKIPIQTYRVFREVLGASLDTKEPLIIGPFTIFNRKLHLTQMEFSKRYIKYLSLVTVKLPPNLEIMVEVKAKDETKALELADAQFYKFELIFKFMVGRRTDRWEVGILNHIGAQLRDYIITNGEHFSDGGEWKGALQPVPLSDPYFSNPSNEFRRLWSLVGKQPTDIEAHVLRCAEWVGQAMADSNSASALVKAAIALEVLFSVSEGVITASIMAQIAESCALILGNSSDNALEIEKEVKRLYGIRSAVVHSGKDSVLPSDLQSFILVSQQIVLMLLSDAYFGKFKSLSELLASLKKLKYSTLDVRINQNSA